MELYTIFRGDYRFMQGEYAEEQQKINGYFNEAYDLVVESLFGHQNSIRVPWHLGRKASSAKPRAAVRKASADPAG
jgi:hypothetical protein